MAEVDYGRLADEAAKHEGIDSALFRRMIGTESAFNPKAVSVKGAQGLGQLMPATAKEMGVTDPFDPEQNIRGSAKYFAQQLRTHNGDVALALASYNAGPGAVAKYKGIPPYKETQDYVRKIMGEDTPTTVATPPAPLSQRVDQRAVAASYNLVSPNTEASIAREMELLAAQGKVNEARHQNRPSLLEMIGAGFAGNGDARLWSGIKETFGKEAYEADPTFKPNLDHPLALADRDIHNSLLLARNSQEEQDIISRHEDEQERVTAVMSRGGWTGGALMIGTEALAVSNWAGAVGAYKAASAARAGSAALALAGRPIASVASGVAENLVAGTGVEVVRQVLNKDLKPGDIVMGAALDVAFGVGFGVHGVQSAAKVLARQHQETSLAKAVDHAVGEEFRREAAARTKLGPDASDEAMRTEMHRMHTEEVLAPVRSSVAEVPTERRIFPVEQSDAEPRRLEQDTGASYQGFLSKEVFEERRARFEVGADSEHRINEYTSGNYKTLAEIDALPAGIHTTGLAKGNPPHLVDMANRLATKFLGKDFRLVVDIGNMEDARGKVMQVSESLAMIRLSKNLNPAEMGRTLAHEIGHVIYQTNLSKLPAAELAKLDTAYKNFLKTAITQKGNGNTARGERFSLLNPDLQPGRTEALPLNTGDSYQMGRHEHAAEQFVKYSEEDWATGNKLGLAEGTIKILKEAITKALDWLKLAKRENIGVTDEYKEFFDNILAGNILPKADDVVPVAGKSPISMSDTSGDSVNDFLANPDVVRLGLSSLPLGTATQRAEAGTILRLHLDAETWASVNPMDDAWKARAKFITADSVFSSIGLNMLTSPNPLVRKVATELLEDASGVAGKRQATAAIAKYMFERTIKGNTVPDMQGAYGLWKKARNMPLKDDIWGGNNWEQFNRDVFAEIEARNSSSYTPTGDGNVIAAADSFEAAMSRSRTLQQGEGTLGADALGSTSVGYVPHMMNAKKVMALSNSERQVLQSALTDQYVSLSGWDITFSDNLAAKVVERMRERASGGYSQTMGGSSTDLFVESMEAMGLSAQEIESRLRAIQRGGASHTKKRIQLDLHKEYPAEEGMFKLMDVYDTDMLTLLEHQTQRVSGEAALAKYGVAGRPGLAILRKAINHGQDGAQATLRDKESFDQMAAEFLGQPFGTHTGKWMERAMIANSNARLGGIIYNQFSEFINGVFHVGAARTMEAVTSIPRLRREIIALSKGEKIDSPILGSIELVGGAEFGTDAYKMVFPFANPVHDLPTYGRDSVTAVDRILRGAGHVQSIVSGWRFMHSAQQRGMAEQIVHKAMRYINEGKDDVALRQFGITPEVQKAVKAAMAEPWFSTFDSSGRLVRLDITKMLDADARDQFVQAIHRGTMQIIQGTFIGERGKWAHDGLLKAMMQFRTFSITSIEKQWGRQRNSRGTAESLGMILGSMSMAIPIYMARVQANAIGREDAEEYVDKMLRPQMVARATLNYIAMSGVGGDVSDLLTSVMPDSWDMRPTGGRPGQATDFVGTYILPASSLIDDAYKYLQQVDDLHKGARLLPMSRVPFILPMINEVPDYSKD